VAAIDIWAGYFMPQFRNHIKRDNSISFMNSIIDSFPSAKEYLISAALNISVPEDFKRIYNGKTQWGDFVYDREKDEFVKILKCETELPTKLFFLVIRPIAPNGYKTIFPNIDYNWAGGGKFEKDDLILKNWNEGFHKIDEKLIDAHVVLVQPMVIFRKRWQ
jgi:hypothetical protein